LLHAHGYRFRLHRADLPGRPDIFLPRHKTAVFVHGCFWHGHPDCKRATVPETRRDFWLAKILRNRERDAQAEAALDSLGCRVVTVWQCELRNPDEILRRIDRATGRSTAVA
jgi:DNA mismatch endonuclease (patch repair protein)